MSKHAQSTEDGLNWIDGEWCVGSAGWYDVADPATARLFARQALADGADVDRAVAAAKRVHVSGVLSDLRPVERGRMVQAMGRFILNNIEEIALTLTTEQGKPLWEARMEVAGAARYFEYYGNQAETVEGRSIPLGRNYLDFTLCEPRGVTAHIIPWNYPIEMAARSLAPALATSNTAVIKSPELTPFAISWLARAATHAGFPAGTVNLLCGLGKDAGALLAAHRDVNLIVFTGSVPTGVSISAAAAKNVVPCILELGGKSAAIVHDDADLDMVLSDVRWGIFFNAGQVCSAMSRVIIHETLYDRFMERAAELAYSIQIAPGVDLASAGLNMGPLVSLHQCERILALISRAASDGGEVISGSRQHNPNGAFVSPTIVGNVTSEMAIAHVEVFGPVLSVLKFTCDDDAIRICNNTPFGLAGGVYTADIDRATYAARRIRAGQVYVNEWYAGGVETPFGGVGLSGYGREKGREALWNYVQTKNIAIRTP